MSAVQTSFNKSTSPLTGQSHFQISAKRKNNDHVSFLSPVQFYVCPTCGHVPTQNTYFHVVVFLQLLQFEPTNAHNFIKVRILQHTSCYTFQSHLPSIKEHTSVHNSCLRFSARSCQTLLVCQSDFI